MSLIQRIITSLVPRKWAESMQAESEKWRIRCLTCGYSISIWEAGGIRWKAYSAGKRTLIRCPHCQGLRQAAVEYELSDAVPSNNGAERQEII